MNRLADFFWYQLPLLTTRFSRHLPTVLADNACLWDMPRVLAFGPISSLLLGFVLGSIRFAPGETYTFSITLLFLMLLVANFSAGLGFWLWLGYATADLLIFRPQLGGSLVEMPLYTAIHIGIPALLLYLLLAGLLIFIPLVSRGLRYEIVSSLAKRMKLLTTAGGATAVVEALLHALIQGGLITLWVQAVPTSIRPVYIWVDSSPPVQAMEPIQLRGWILSALGAALGAWRVFLEYQCAANEVSFRRARQLEDALAGIRSLARPSRHTLGRVVGKSVLITFLLSGLTSSWIEALLLSVVLVATFVWHQSLAKRNNRWNELIRRTPLVVRLLAACSFSYYLGAYLLQSFWSSTSSFLPVLLGVVTSFFILSGLFPEDMRMKSE